MERPGRSVASRLTPAGIIPRMARRLLAWALVTPLAAAGILGAHAAAYRLTGTDPGPVHAYLAHAPQVLAVLVSIGLVGLAVQERSRGRGPLWPLALVGPVGFACQEHLERLAHTGDLPLLVTSPSFLLGLVLQVPVVVLCVVVARRIAGSLARIRAARPPLVADVWLPLPTLVVATPRSLRLSRPTGRGPPRLLVP